MVLGPSIVILEFQDVSDVPEHFGSDKRCYNAENPIYNNNQLFFPHVGKNQYSLLYNLKCSSVYRTGLMVWEVC